MLKIIYFLLFCLMLIACDNQLLEPNYNESEDIEKLNTEGNALVSDQLSPRKSYKLVPFFSEYMFNSKSRENDCGGFLNKCYLEYDYENEYERVLRNVKFYSHSKMVIDGKTYKTFSIYTMNKREFINNKGAVIGGKAWGSFTIHKVEKIPVIYDEEGVIKNDFIAEHPLKYLGAVVLDGKFTGEITGPKIAMRLIGDGSDFLKGGKLTAKEEMECGSRFCWKSKIIGKIKKVDYIDE